MKLKRCISLLLITVCLAACTNIFVSASTNSEVSVDAKIPFDSPVLNQYGSIYIKDSITVNGKIQNLYPVFDNQTQALANFITDNATFLTNIKSTYEISENLCDANWEEYRDAVYTYMSGPYSDSNEIALRNCLHFFDIYENDAQNTEIKILHQNESNLLTRAMTNNDYQTQLALMLPYTSELAQELNESVVNRPQPRVTFNLQNAISYANRWATKRNPDYYSYGADCTNFCSQILEAGGVSQVTDPNDNENNGWWHKVVPVAWWTEHKSSSSWRLADVFARYQGIFYRTQGQYAFSEHVQAGDFIAGDWESDGSWNHVAFITSKSVCASTYVDQTGMSRYYYDYRVAQHTNDYVAWVSSNTNNWESVGQDGGTYARIRGR